MNNLTLNTLFRKLYGMSRHQAGTCQSEWLRSILGSYHRYKDKRTGGCLYLCSSNFLSRFMNGKERIQEQITIYYLSSERGVAFLRSDIEAYCGKIAFTEGRRQEHINAITELILNAPNLHPKDKKFILEAADDSSVHLAQMCFRAILVLM